MGPKTRGGSASRPRRSGASSSRPSRTSLPIPPVAISSSHILPPPPHYGNPPLHSLMVDTEAVERYRKFCNKEFVVMHSLSTEFLDSLHIPKLHDLIAAQPMFKSIVDHESLIYPSMVTQFFANLRYHSPGFNTLLSYVNNVEIKLNETILNNIFHTTLPSVNPEARYWDTSRQWPPTSPVFNLSELQNMFKTNETEAKLFNPTVLAPEDRVIYHILVNFVNPVAGHFTSPGKVPLVYYYFFTHKIPIDWGFILHSRLVDLLTDTRRSFLHAQFLTDIFRHFKVPLFHEPGIAPHPFDFATLNKKGIRLVQGKWITRADLNSSRASSSKPPPVTTSRPSPTSSSPSSTSEIQALQAAIEENTRHMRYLQFGVGMLMNSEDREYFQDARFMFGIDNDEEDQDVSQDASDAESEDATSPSSGDVPLSQFKRPRQGD